MLKAVAIEITLPGNQHFTVDDLRLADLVEFERRYGVGAPALDDPAQQKVEWVSFLAFTALRRRGEKIPDDFDVFLSSVEDFEVRPNVAGAAEEGDAPDPS